MDTLKFIREKAGAIKEGAGKKTDELMEKAAELKKDYDESQRKKLESWVYKKEEELKSLERSLKEREKIIAAKELKLQGKFFIRFMGGVASLSLLGFLVLAYYVKDMPPRVDSSTVTQASKIVSNSAPTALTAPFTPREKSIYSTFDDIDADNPNFDVGGYCLKKEKQGNITFEECLTVAAAKIWKNKH